MQFADSSGSNQIILLSPFGNSMLLLSHLERPQSIHLASRTQTLAVRVPTAPLGLPVASRPAA